MTYTREEWTRLSDEDRGPCREWTKGRSPRGYGKVKPTTNEFGQQLVHRLAWMREVGPIPDETPCVLHHCDNPACYRVDHLWLGTRADNNVDRDNKGRNVALFGEEHSRSKLTREAVADIRRRESVAGVLASKYKVSVHTVYAVWQNRVWVYE